MLMSLLGFDTFLKHMVYRHYPRLGSLYTNVVGKACFLPESKVYIIYCAQLSKLMK